MTLAVIGLGSSLGDRYRHLRLASVLLCAPPTVHWVRGSRLWRSRPMGGVARGWFLNGAVSIQTSLSPTALLAWCKEIERRVGRRPGLRWTDRVVDLDILLYGDQQLSLDGLEIPHRGLLSRNFALVPAREVAPGLRHVGDGRLLSGIPSSSVGLCEAGILVRYGLAAPRRTHYSDPGRRTQPGVKHAVFPRHREPGRDS